MAEEIQKKKAGLIVGDSGHAVTISDNGTDKRKILQGSDKPGKPSLDSSIVVWFFVFRDCFGLGFGDFYVCASRRGTVSGVKN